MENVIIGAGGFAREVRCQMHSENIKMFVDDEYWIENNDNIFSLKYFDANKHIAVIAIGNPKDREDMVNKLPLDTQYFTFIHKTAQILSNDIVIGLGSIICANCIITTNVKLGRHTHLNLSSTIGHDCLIGDFFTTAPGVKISGKCNIGNRVYFGTNSSIREKITVCNDVTVGLNSGVVKNIIETGTYGGVPVKKLLSK